MELHGLLANFCAIFGISVRWSHAVYRADGNITKDGRSVLRPTISCFVMPKEIASTIAPSRVILSLSVCCRSNTNIPVVVDDLSGKRSRTFVQYLWRVDIMMTFELI